MEFMPEMNYKVIQNFYIHYIHVGMRYVQISEKGNYENFRYLQKHVESKKSIFENFERQEFLEISEISETGNYWFWKFRKLPNFSN